VNEPLAPDLDIFGAQEAAQYLGLTRTNFNVRRFRSAQDKHPLPEPMWTLKCGPIWTREQLDEWREKQ